MTQIGKNYAQALYSLAEEEAASEAVLEQLKALHQAFLQEPDYLRLLALPKLPKEERCQILDDSFRGKVHPYVLNLMKIMVEKGHLRCFESCYQAYREQYNLEMGILPVCAVTAIPLDDEQSRRLTQKLEKVTGKRIELENRTDPACLGGVRLCYEGKQIDGTIQGHLESIGALLKNTIL